MKTSRFITSSIAFLLAIFSYLACSKPTDAQTFGNPIFPQVKYKAKPEQPPTVGKEIILPDIPRFPDAKFICAQDLAKRTGAKVAYIIEYSIPKSSESSVIPYYGNIFHSAGWIIDHQSQRSIGANNSTNNASCDVIISSENEYFSKLEINYSVVSPPG